MHRAQKPKHIQEVKELVGNSSAVILAHQSGLTVAESTAIRGQMRSHDGRFKVIKNRLMVHALKGEPYEQLMPSFKGPVVMFCASDPVAAAKVSVKAEKELNGKITIITALCDGKIFTVDEVKTLAVLPSLDALRGQLAGLLTAVAGKLVRLTREPAAMLNRLIHSKPAAEKPDESPEKSLETPAAEATSAEVKQQEEKPAESSSDDESEQKPNGESSG